MTEDKKTVQDKAEDEEERTLEETFQDLDKVIQDMEEGDLSLEESFQAYHKGMDLLKSCNDKIDRVEKQVMELDEEGETHEFTQ